MSEGLLSDIEESVRKLCVKRGIAVELVRFFGSRTKGTMSSDSDVDMILVSPTFEGKDIFQRAEMTKGLHRELVKRFHLPFDIVLYSSNEWSHGNSLLLHEIRLTLT